MEEHNKDTCEFLEYFDKDIIRIQDDVYYDIYQIASNHYINNCQYNLQNSKLKWSATSEDNEHSIEECPLNGKTKSNYHVVYHT